MALFKCKMCGGNIEFNPGDTVGICDSCGTKQTLPKLDDDRRANLYDRANHFRRNNEFDKAMSIYEKILEEDNTDAETYWSIVLCRYGIEYVEDPATHKRVPTVNRAQYSSVVSDKDYKSALKYGTPEQKDLYKAEARAIDKIQKGILEISQKEEPFDVFICYKETDNQGRRTPDSVLANDLYHQLVQEGFKVFFSRITLEDKLGTAYEPYIFAALNSAKVMVVLGTKPEYFNAVWVKNEWNRYLALVNASSGKKMLIPAYKDMDPYDLPEEFSHLQAQDMSKLGFMQDLIRGIKKIVSVQAPDTVAKTASVISSPVAAGTNTSPLLKRAFMFLEDEEWDRADDFCEQVLNLDPENAQAYLGKMMAELHVRKQDDLADLPEPFYSNSNFQKFVRFGDEESVSIVKSYNQKINERNENNRKLKIYNDAVNAMNTANTESAYKTAAESFKSISEFKDADELAEKCLEYAETCRKAQLYNTAKSYMTGFEVGRYEKAIKYFESVSGWKDSDEQISLCRHKIEEIKAKIEADRLESERKAEEKRILMEKAMQVIKIILKIGVPTVAVLVIFIIIINTVIIPSSKYSKAVKLYEKGKYKEAITTFEKLDGYKDSNAQITAIKKSNEYIKAAGVYDTFLFGSYEQDCNTSNGKEDVEWLVLAKENTKVLVISRYALDCQQYNTSFTDVDWETCSLRKWLNGTFLNAAFSSDEQKIIISSTITADINTKYSTNPGNDTTDKIFLLSINEVDKYFSSGEERKCVPTDYAIAQGTYTKSNDSSLSKANCCWWLRSPGYKSNFAAGVNQYGFVSSGGKSVVDDMYTVRPAMWISIE